MGTLSVWLRVYVIAMVVFLIAPVAIVVIVSFTGANFVTFPPRGVSLKWFAKVLTSEEFIYPFWNSLRLGVVSTVASMVLAVPAALALVRHRLPFSSVILSFLLSPLSLPTIILAVGLLFFLAAIGVVGSFWGLVAGHVVIIVPYVLRTVLGVYSGINREVEEAARVLGASSLQTFRLVTLPMIRPGLLAGGIFAFLLSFDEVPVALLLSNLDTVTLPVSILSYLVHNYDPAVAAVSTVQIVVVVVMLLLLERFFGVGRMVLSGR